MHYSGFHSAVVSAVHLVVLFAGKILRQWGAGHFFMPHMITVDRNNTVWIADTGRHQVLKFTAGGKFIMAAGIKNKPGPAKAKFCKPTQVHRSPVFGICGA